MAKWVIKVDGKKRTEIDKHLIVQAVLALGRQLKEQNMRRASEPVASEERR